jgi:uncharacterized protein with beta-barrel porin domain
MPITNRKLARAVRKRLFTGHIDLSAAGRQASSFVCPENRIKILRTDIVYDVATSVNVQGEKATVGIAGALTRYLNATIAVSQAQGTVQSAAPLSTLEVEKNTAVIIQKDTVTGTANTGEVTVNVWYELVDRPGAIWT